VAPLQPVRLPAGAALHGDGALSDYRQLLLARGIVRVEPKSSPRVARSALDLARGTALLPELNVMPTVVTGSRRATPQTAAVAALTAFLSVAALLLRYRIVDVSRRLRARVRPRWQER
jgi:hypothetical protein